MSALSENIANAQENWLESNIRARQGCAKGDRELSEEHAQDVHAIYACAFEHWPRRLQRKDTFEEEEQ